jgi:membrane protease YdiL (CAAX protease family)
MASSSLREKIRSIALPFALSGSGLGVAFALKKLLHVDLSKLELSVIALVVTSLCVLLLLPKVFKIPFGKVSIGYFIKNVGLSIPGKTHKFVLLGILAALFTLSGMLVGSMLTGKFVFTSDTITLGQAVFSLTPGIWEEVLFRGVIMIALLRLTKSFKKAAIIQVVIFGIGHVKGIDLEALVESFSVMVMAVAFTYIAYKTRSLIPGITFHYLHDTFLFFVQLPGGEYSGFRDNALFYAGLWTAVALAVLCIRIVADKCSIVSEYDFYSLQVNDPELEQDQQA